MPQLWIYGCSQSNPSHLVKAYGESAYDDFWAKILADKLGYEVRYCSRPGSCVEQTARSLFRTQSLWKTQDKVIIGVTSPYRDLCYVDNPAKDIQRVECVMAHQTSNPDYPGIHPGSKKALNEYFYDVKNRYRDQLTSWWEKTFSYLNPDYLWTWNEWSKPGYTRICDEIEGNYDTHWGKHTNSLFANKIYKKLVENEE